MFLFSVAPFESLTDGGHRDKVVHLGVYALFAWLLVQAIRAGGLQEREHLCLAWIYATSYGLLIELVQGLTPWRSADVVDAAANAMGAALGTFLCSRARGQTP